VRLGRDTRVVVTGASRGIGRALARGFAARGAVLGLLARSEDGLREVEEGIPGDEHHILAADVGDAAAVRRALEAFGRADVVVANAGVAHYGPFLDMDLEKIERMTRINWLGTVYTVAAALPPMLERRSGHLVVVSSGAGLRAFPEAAVYGATKAAQRGFAEALRHELAGTGVSLTTVFPGEFATTLHDHEKETLPDWYDGDGALPPERLADRVVRAVEEDEREVYAPALVRVLRLAHGVSPRLGDVLLRRLRGESAAPRHD